MNLRGSLHLLKWHTECWLGTWARFLERKNALRATWSSPAPHFTEKTEAREGTVWVQSPQHVGGPSGEIQAPQTYILRSPRVPHKDKVYLGGWIEAEDAARKRQFHLHHNLTYSIRGAEPGLTGQASASEAPRPLFRILPAAGPCRDPMGPWGSVPGGGANGDRIWHTSHKGGCLRLPSPFPCFCLDPRA